MSWCVCQLIGIGRLAMGGVYSMLTILRCFITNYFHFLRLGCALLEVDICCTDDSSENIVS